MSQTSAQEVLSELDIVGLGMSRTDWIALLEELEGDIQARLEAAREEQENEEG